MLKTITFAAAGALVAFATPAAAGPGVVLQGKDLNGVNLQGVGNKAIKRDGAMQPQSAPSPTIPAFAMELAGRPAQPACAGCTVKFNGRSLNGVVFNGIKLQGAKLNGLTLNGKLMNGKMFNGTATGAPEQVERDATFTVAAVTLPGGERIVLR